MTISMSEPKRRWQVPPLATDDRWIGGVAAAIATEVGVQPLIIRAAFGFLTLAGGGGLILYALFWAALAVYQPSRLGPYRPVPKALSPARRTVAIALITLGLGSVVNSFGFGLGPQFLIPMGLILTGGLVAWSQRSDGDGISAASRILLGVVLVAVGLGTAVFLSVSLFEAIRLLLLAVVVVGGMVMVIAPSVIRIGQAFDNERQERVRADERARMAAHLHDSVLQSLSLIQRNADDPRRTAQIARQQERELRHWLYGDEPSTPGTTRLTTALQAAAGRVEEHHDVRVEVVAVGDNEDLDPALIDGLVAAAQEAMTNAANHAGVPTVDVYAERRPELIEVFVRDAGSGFDPKEIGEDRQGVRSSIIDRMAREGGWAAVHSEIGRGTEVELVLPVKAPANPSENGSSSDEPVPASTETAAGEAP